MTQIELNKINESLYEDAKIYYAINKGYSSKLFENMVYAGNKMVKIGKVSAMLDKDGCTIASGIGRIDFLQQLAYIMQ